MTDYFAMLRDANELSAAVSNELLALVQLPKVSVWHPFAFLFCCTLNHEHYGIVCPCVLVCGHIVHVCDVWWVYICILVSVYLHVCVCGEGVAQSALRSSKPDALPSLETPSLVRVEAVTVRRADSARILSFNNLGVHRFEPFWLMCDRSKVCVSWFGGALSCRGTTGLRSLSCRSDIS